MKEKKVVLMAVSLAVVTILLISTAQAGSVIKLEKDVVQSELLGMPNEITFYLYDSITASVPIAIQTFSKDEWSADGDLRNWK